MVLANWRIRAHYNPDRGARCQRPGGDCVPPAQRPPPPAMEEIVRRIAAKPAKYAEACASHRRGGSDPRGAFVVRVDAPEGGPLRVLDMGYASRGQVDSMRDAYLRALVEEADHEKELVLTVRSVQGEALSASVPLAGGEVEVHVMPQNAGLDPTEGPAIPAAS